MSDMARSPFSTVAFAQLVRRLRHTNARYNQIALQFRCSLRRTNHAKRRAYRVGLRIDTTKARACPNKYISTHSPPLLDRSEVGPGWPDASANAHATAEIAITGAQDAFPDKDAYMRPAPRRKSKVVVQRRLRNGQSRVVIRLPPFKPQINLDYPSTAPFEGPAPRAPRLSPCDLPEDDCGTEDVIHGSISHHSFVDESDESLNPHAVRVYSGLCITIPPRALKRKLQDVEPDETVSSPQQPKRFLRARWDDSQRQRTNLTS